MIKIVSKLDKKEYYLATFMGGKVDEEIYSNKGKYIGRFIEGKKYQVRKATEEDCEDSENYCVVNGVFFDERFLTSPLSSKLLNRYTGTHHLHVIISKDAVKRHLDYIVIYRKP